MQQRAHICAINGQCLEAKELLEALDSTDIPFGGVEVHRGDNEKDELNY